MNFLARLCLMAIGFATPLVGGESALSGDTRREANRAIDDLALDLLWVPPGTFTMGSPNGEPERNLD